VKRATGPRSRGGPGEARSDRSDPWWPVADRATRLGAEKPVRVNVRGQPASRRRRRRPAARTPWADGFSCAPRSTSSMAAAARSTV